MKIQIVTWKKETIVKEVGKTCFCFEYEIVVKFISFRLDQTLLVDGRTTMF
jgi:hypothetical protein